MPQIDARLDALLRRDPSGVYLPLTPEERTKHTKKFGPDEVQNAEAQIQRARDAADAKAQAAQKNALEAEKTRAALEIAKQQGAMAQQKANSEAEAAAADTERKRTTTNRINTKQGASDEYNKGLTAQFAQGAQGPAALTGTAAGIGAGIYIGRGQKKSIQDANTERQKAAAKVEKLNPNTASPSEYDSIYRGAKQAGLVPSSNPLSAISRGVSRFAPFAGTAAAFGADAAVMRYLANKRDEDNMSPDSLKKDIMNDAGAIGVGGGLGALGEGALYTLFPGAHPDAAALASIELARQKAKELAANPNPPQGQLPPAETKQLPPPRPYSGPPKEQIREIGKALGDEETPSSAGKTRAYKGALGALENAQNHDIAHVHARIPEANPADDAITAIRKHLAKMHEAKSPIGGKAGLLGILGLGAGAAALGSDEAEAAPVERAMNTARKQTEQAPSEYSDLDKEYGTGFPLKKARQVAKDVADVGSYQLPVIGEARMVADAPNAYKPSDEDLADAEYWQKGREEMTKPHGRAQAPVAPEADTAKEGFKQGGTVDFDPAHLPEHERSFLHNPEEAHERAKWILPYVRAGAEAQKRGEDFFGGSDQYERELAALKQFYHGGAVHRADGGESTLAKTTPSDPTGPDDFGVGKLKGVLNKANQYDRARSGPVDQFDRLPAKKNWYGAPTGEKYEDRLTEDPKFKHGGKVTTAHEKHIHSIGESFRTKLEEKKRMLSSLRKAYDKAPNPKLKSRIVKEEKLSQAIESHLKSFA